MDWGMYWFMFPSCIAIATLAMLSGISGAALLTPVMILGFPFLAQDDPHTRKEKVSFEIIRLGTMNRIGLLTLSLRQFERRLSNENTRLPDMWLFPGQAGSHQGSGGCAPL